jgi:S1-C subfamily serine protease
MAAVFTHIAGVKRGQREVAGGHQITVGRAPTNTLSFAPTDTRASAHHAEIAFDGSGWVLRDAGSTNGTFVNGQRVHSARLNPGDIIEFGTGGPQLQFGVEPDVAGHPPAFVETESGSGPPPRPAAAPISKEFGRTTMRLMIEHAVEKSSTQFRVMVVALVALVILLSATTLLLAFKSSPLAPSDFRAIARENQGAVVFIYVRFLLVDDRGRPVQESASTGSGFMVSPEGHIITNRHVVRLWEYEPEWTRNEYTGEIREIKVVFADHDSNDAIAAEIVQVSDSHDTDVAILRVPPFADMPVLHNFNRDVSSLSQGDPVGVIGYPFGAELFEFTKAKKAETSFSQGHISKVTPSKIQVDAPANPGNSGGPIFDEEGRVIGILTQGLASMGAQNINFGTPIGHALDMLERAKGPSAATSR